MKHYSNILMPYDGSNISGEALQVAETIAVNQEAALTVLYVHDNTQEEAIRPLIESSGDPHLLQTQTNLESSPMPMLTPDQITNSDKDRIAGDIPDSILAGARSRITSDIDVSYDLVYGKPAKEISKYTHNHDMDLIVMGSRGLSGVRKLTMGSVSSKVSNEVGCSIFFVR